MLNLKKSLLRVLLLLLCTSLVLVCPATPVWAQNDWSQKVLKQRKPDQKEKVAFQLAQRQGVSDLTMLTLAERERHGPAVAAVAGQYFEKASKVPDSFDAIQAVVKRKDIGAKAVAFAAVSPISEQLIVSLIASPKEVDRLVAARMIASLALMRHGQAKGNQDAPEEQPKHKKGDVPTWLLADHSESIKALIEHGTSRATLEYALLAAGLDRVESARALVQDRTTHHVQEVAYAALDGEIDSAQLLVDLKETERERERGKPPLSYEPTQSPLVYAIMAAGEAGVAEATDPLLGYVSDRDLHVAVAAVRALSQIGGDGLAVRLLETIGVETLWPVRVALYDAIGANPDSSAVPALLERFKAETGRLRQDVLHALLSIAAGNLEDPTIEGFAAWWEVNGDGFVADPATTRSWRTEHKVGHINVKPFAGFYETAVISDSLVFAIDASKSINQGQLELLQKTLTEMFAVFPEEIRFNLVDFGGHVRLLAKGRMVNGKVRERALDVFLKKTELTFGTRIFDAIEVAMDVPEVDTLHFLSDGEPYGSQINNWRRIDYVTRLRCSTVPIAVHVIFLPKNGKPEQVAKRPLAIQMRDFAHAHAGRFRILVSEKK